MLLLIYDISLIKIQKGGHCNRQLNGKPKECKDKEFRKTDIISLETKSIWLLLISRCSYWVLSDYNPYGGDCFQGYTQ